jgi:hypothetical protein
MAKHHLPVAPNTVLGDLARELPRPTTAFHDRFIGRAEDGVERTCDAAIARVDACLALMSRPD